MSNNLANRKIFLNKKQKHIRLRRHKNYLDAKLHQRSFLGNTKKENEQHRNFNQCDATTNIENIFTDNLNLVEKENETYEEEFVEELEEEYFEDFEEELDDSEDQQEFLNYNTSEFIYGRSDKGSSLTNDEFNISFQWICTKLKISISNRNVLLHYIKNLLPPNNKIASSYYIINKKLTEKTKMQKKNLKYARVVMKNLKNNALTKSVLIKKKKLFIDVAFFDFQAHLELILKKNWLSIIEFKSKF